MFLFFISIEKTFKKIFFFKQNRIKNFVKKKILQYGNTCYIIFIQNKSMVYGYFECLNQYLHRFYSNSLHYHYRQYSSKLYASNAIVGYNKTIYFLSLAHTLVLWGYMFNEIITNVREWRIFSWVHLVE